MSYIDRIDFIVNGLKTTFPKIRVERVLMKDGTFKIQVSQDRIYTNKGVRRSVSYARIEKAIKELNQEWTNQHK